MELLLSPLREFRKKGDLILLLLCLLASTFGLALIYSATRYTGRDRFILVQALAICIGVGIYILLTFVNLQSFTERQWKLLLAFNIIFILLLLTPLGTDHNSGNLNWLALDKIIPRFPLDIQPNEIVKIPFVLLLSLQIVKIKERGADISSIPSVMQIGCHAAMMLALIAVVCGDMGMCVVYLLIFVIMAWSAGVKARWFLITGGLIVAAAVILWLFVLPDTALWDTNYMVKRIRALLDHSYDPQGVGWQQTRSLMAIGAGRFTGQGYLHGTRTQSLLNESLPARHTDFIFAVCGEELGTVGCCLLLAVLASIILRCFWVGLHATSPFYAYVCVGMGGMLLIQIALNVGMCLFIAPCMGLTLPFISYGGSSIITLFAAMGIVSSAKAQTLPSWLRDRNRM